MSKIFTAIALVFSLTSWGLAGSSPALSANNDCPSGTTFIAKYEVANTSTATTFAEGTNVITFSDKVAHTDGELVRFDFSSTMDVTYVFVKAGNSPGDSGNYDYRPGSVRSGNDLATPTAKGVSHITFCGPTGTTTGTTTGATTGTTTGTSTPPPTVAGVQQPAVIGSVNPSVDQRPAAQAVLGSQPQSVATQAAPAGLPAQGTIALPSSSTAAQVASGTPLGAMLLAAGAFLLRRRKS